MPKAFVNGIDLYYESHGSGPALVFAHGRGGNHFSWWQQLAEFSDQYRCITFDHRGWGLTEGNGSDGINQAGFTEDLRGLLDYLELDKVALVSQSMGGITNLGFTLRFPERVSALVLGDTTGGIGDPAVVDLLRNVHPPEDTLGRALSKEFIASEPEKTMLFQQIGLLNPPMPISVISPLFRDPSGPQAADLAIMNTPTLLIVGEEDLIFPPHVMTAVTDLIPGAVLEVVPGAAHSTHFEQAAKFNQLVHEFLDGVPYWS
jgi:3-oxoadipate enol-lactonase